MKNTSKNCIAMPRSAISTVDIMITINLGLTIGYIVLLTLLLAGAFAVDSNKKKNERARVKQTREK